MTPISATAQKSSPKLDRDILAPKPEADPPAASEAVQPRGFGAVLQAAARPPGAAPVAAGPGEADEEAGFAEAAGSGDGPGVSGTIPALPTTDAAAILAGILSTMRPADVPAPASVAGTGDGSPRPAGSASPGSGIPATTGDAGGPGVPDDVSGLGRAPAVAVLDRAVHFKPVLSSAVPGADTAPGAPEKPVTTAGAGSTRPTFAAPGAPASAKTDIAADPPVRTGRPNSAAAGTPQVPLSVRIPPEPQPGDSAPGSPAAAPDRSDVPKPEDSWAVVGIAGSGTARTVMASADRHAPANGPASESRAAAGAGPGTLVLALPTIAAAIADEIARAATPGPDPVGNRADPAVAPPPDGPLRVLRIQLKPEELGTVTVELRLANGQLETHLRASRPETATLLHRDAAILTDLLKQANYQATVTVGPARPADAGGFSGGAPPQGQPNFTDGGARPGTGENRQRRAAHPSATGRHDGERMDETVRPRDGGVYL